MRYLLDTNVVSDLVRNPQGKVALRIRRVGEARVCTSIIVAAELRYGAAKRRSAQLSAQLDAVLSALDVLPFEPPADAIYASLRTGLEGMGTPIGANDMLIAAQALALGYTIVTDNEREFARVRNLSCENWLRWTHQSGLEVYTKRRGTVESVPALIGDKIKELAISMKRPS